MYAKYLLFAMISVAADVLAFILAPIAVLFVRDGKLPKLWRWITTHDAPIDSGHIDGYWEAPKTKIGLYWSRVKWIWRNPAYQVGHWLGYSQEGVTITKHYDNVEFWDTGIPNKAYWTAINSKGQEAFLYEKQSNWKFPFFKTVFTFEQQYGWKLYRNDPDKVCMLALRISPFKQYPKPSK